MPEITPTVTADVIDTREELAQLAFDLADAGWNWSMGMYADTPTEEPRMRMDAHIEDLAEPSKVRTIRAYILDVKVCIGSRIQIFTPEAYAESFGAATEG